MNNKFYVHSVKPSTPESRQTYKRKRLTPVVGSLVRVPLLLSLSRPTKNPNAIVTKNLSWSFHSIKFT